MAFEQNPYAVKITMTADNTLNSTITNGIVSSSPQFKFVKVAGLSSAAFTGTTTTNSSQITGITVASSAGIVLGAPVTAAAGTSQIPAGAFITGLTYSGTTITAVNLSVLALTSATITANVTPSSQPYQNGPVATLVTAASDRAVGVLQNQPITKLNANAGVEGNSEAEITISGITKVIAGAAVTAGAPITVDSSGRAVSTTFYLSGTNVTSTTIPFVVGTALTPASAAGDVITLALSAAAAVRAI